MYNLLSGLRVIEGAAFVAGPSCGLHLLQAGADVVRFDAIGGGPDAVRWPRSSSGGSYYWDGLNKGKRSIAIDLANPDGRALAQRLAVSGDGLFVTNYPAEGFLSYERLRVLRPELICLRIMGWSDGRQAVDYTVNAAVGIPDMTGPADDPRPVNHVLPAWDLTAGAYAAFILLAALRERDKSQQGKELRLSLADLAAATLGHLGQVAEVSESGTDRAKHGNDLFGALGRDFITKDDARLMVVALTAKQWRSLVSALGLGTVIAEMEMRLSVSFLDEGLRYLHREHLLPVIENAIRDRNANDVGAAFEKAGVCWSRYQTLADAVATDRALFSANPVFSMCTHPATGTYLTPGSPVRIGQLERETPRPAPRLGEHTDEILAEFLGMTPTEIGKLHDAGLVKSS